MGVEDQAENKKYCKAVGMGMMRSKNAVSGGRQKYIEHIGRMNNKTIVRSPTYHAGMPRLSSAFTWNATIKSHPLLET
jgi:hypothetical protein